MSDRLPAVTGVVDPLRPGGRPAVWAATGRLGGVSGGRYDCLNLADYVGDEPAAVAANRARLVRSLGLPGHRLAVMDAVHGAHVAVVDGPGTVAGVDGLVTREVGLVVLALGADCVPIALVGVDGRAVAVAHCGWRGLVVDVVGATARAMEVPIAHAVLGPSVCGSCYPVPVERARAVERSCSPAVAAAAITSCPDGQPGIDVRRGLQARLAELGAQTTTWAGGCTVEDPGLYSYRRDGLTGRQGIAVCLVDDRAPAAGRMEP